MGYEDFWFIDIRNQRKNVKRWILYVILIFAFVSIGAVVCVKSMYKPITIYEIQATVPAINVEEAKSTNVNGYIKGQVKNNSEEELQGKYIKFSFYNEKNVNVGNEYIEIGNLQSLQTKQYEVKFRYSNVEKFIIQVTDNKQ